MYIEEIILEGFKSYATRTVISAWDPQFNAITGLNGSGKSNILDAICFVLGIDNLKQVRATSLQDLIYKRGQSGITKASVSLIFNNTDPAQSPIGYADCPKLTVTRQVVVGGKNKYLVNGHVATNRVVENLFQSVQLNVNNPHFLIMQGQITKVLNMKPPEILAMLEEAAGTRMFEDRRTKALSTLDKKDKKVEEIESLIAEVIGPKLTALRAERAQFMEYKRGEAEADRLRRLLLAYQFVTQSAALDASNERLAGLKGSAEAFAQEETEKRTELKEVEGQVKQLIKQHEAEQSNPNVQRLKEALHSANLELTRICTQLELLMEQKASSTGILAKKQKAQTKEVTAQAKAAERLASCRVKLEDLRAEHDKVANGVRQSEELLQGLETGVSLSEDGSGDTGYAKMLADLRGKQREANLRLQEAQLRIQAVSEEIGQLQPKAASATTQTAQLQNQIATLETEITQSKALISSSTASSASSPEKWSRLQAQIGKIRGQLDQLHGKVAHLNFRYTDPHPGFDRGQVRGVVAQLLRLPSDEAAAKYSTALEVAAGGRLYNVVVDSERVAGELLERGRLQKRVTIIPLDRIQPRLIPEDKKRAALTDARIQSALQLVIPAEADLSPAIEYVFGGTLVCEGAESAAFAAFDKKIGVRAVTLDGDIYEPSGTLTGGRQGGASSSKLIEHLHLFNSIQLELTCLEQESAALEGERKAAEEAASLQQTLQLKEHELSLLKRQFEQNAQGRLISRLAALKEEQVNLHSTINCAKKEAEELKSQCSQCEKEAADFAANRSDRLKSLQSALKKAKAQLEAEADKLVDGEREFSVLEGEVQEAAEAAQKSCIQIAQLQNEISLLEKEASALEGKKGEIEEQCKQLELQLETEQQHLIRLSSHLSALQEQKSSLTEHVEKLALLQKKLIGDIEKAASEVDKQEEALKEILRQAPWIEDCYEQFGKTQEFNFEGVSEAKKRLDVLSSQLSSLRRSINPNVMDMIERLESKETSLNTMLSTVHHDKTKISSTISTLDDFKREALERTCTQVDVDFGAIFADLLPGAFCRLEPVSEGLEIRVQLGGVWKESLTELSGGQRSLTALALILALLRFRPAPMYILDEVDAALDLSHTQNIGSLLKRRFRGSQFIVVSLKEGMFTNANVLFRTRFRDGVSSVERHVQANEEPKKKKRPAIGHNNDNENIQVTSNE